MSISKNYILKKIIKENYEIQLSPTEQVLYSSTATELSMSGKFRMQQNIPHQRGRLLVTNQRVIFNGISKQRMVTTQYGTSFHGTGSSSYSFSINGARASVQKMSIPEKIGSLGLKGLMMRIFNKGYVRIDGNGGTRGYYVDNPQKLIMVVNSASAKALQAARVQSAQQVQPQKVQQPIQ